MQCKYRSVSSFWIYLPLFLATISIKLKKEIIETSLIYIKRGLMNNSGSRKAL